MADKERDAALREMARSRGFKLVKSRRRKPGGDFGRYGLQDAASGEECLGFSGKGLTATAEEVEAFLRQQTASTWKKSLGSVPKPAKTAGRSRKAPGPSPEPKKKSPPAPPEKPKLRIREADAVDAEAIAALVSNFAPTSAEDIAERLPLLSRGGEPPLVARLGEEVVGVITWHVTPALHRPKPVGRITYLEVAEDYQRQGIGQALVQAVEERLIEKGCGLIEVTSNMKLTKAHTFYRALGFERTSYRFGKPLKR
jgi:ribosomal protein S18 acetylase RimI-like enzyme